MDIFMKDNTTGRIIKGSRKMLKTLGGNWRQVAPPQAIQRKDAEMNTQSTPPAAPKEAEKVIEKEVPEEVTKKEVPEGEPEREMTKKELLDAIKASGYNQKGLHLFKIDKLKTIYDEVKNQENG